MRTSLPHLNPLLHHLTKTKSLHQSLTLHSHLIKTGQSADLIISNHLINLYIKLGHIFHARTLFDSMPQRNVVTWSALISGYTKSNQSLKAIHLFSLINVQPNEYVYASIIAASAGLLDVSLGTQIHAKVVKTWYIAVSFVSNSLMSMYMKCECQVDAYEVFDEAVEVNSVTYNAMITGFAENKLNNCSLDMFGRMTRHGLCPDMFTYAAVIGVCVATGDIRTGLGLHCQTIKVGLDVMAFVGNVILTMYSQSGLIGEVEKLFWLIEEKDIISLNTFIAACCCCGEHTKGLRIFTEMECRFGLIHDDFTLASALAACSGLGSVDFGKQVHSHLIKTKIELDIGVYNALMNMYAKCGYIGYALSIFRRMTEKNVVSWNSVIAALGSHGRGNQAVEYFEQMVVAGMVPDSVSLVGLLTACSHAGLVDEGMLYFNKMQEIYRISPQVEHLSCIVDLLGRTGRLQEAENYIKSSPYNDDSIIWGSLLSSAQLHGNVVVGERAVKKLLDLQSSTSSPYVLLANLYASGGRWQGVSEARKLLKSSGVKKEPGFSSVEVKGVTERFISGDFSNFRIVEIKKVLASLNWSIRELTSLNKI